MKFDLYGRRLFATEFTAEHREVINTLCALCVLCG
jgi:hypothetical protein